MNIKTKLVISDIHGKTGTSVIRAIINGERDAENFLKFKDVRIRASDEEFILALQGNWKEEQLYLLKSQYEMYKFLDQQRQELDVVIEQVLCVLADSICKDTKVNEKKKKAKTKSSPMFDVQKYLRGILGVDPTEIYGIQENAALNILAETGYDLKAKFPSSKQFVSWLNLVPDTKISRGKVLSSKMKKKKNKAGQVFRQSASTLWRSKNPLAEKLKSKKAKKGAGPAIESIAKTIATIYYNMITKQQEFDPENILKENSQKLENKIKYFERKAQELRILYEQNGGLSNQVI